jgi:eukaryotic-like serine/threonine-protein kinase
MPESAQIRNLFDRARDLDIAERNLFLDEACPGAIRGELNRLLENYERLTTLADGELPTMAAKAASGSPRHHPALTGPYQIIREIASGGMGSVYLAERSDDEYRKLVAVKLLRQGLASDAAVRRFRHERQILASIEHPYIARLLDGGSTRDGLPYLVMEYVDGQRIDEFCNSRMLSVVERLALFQKVCAAVHFAHQHLVVHRDLKPGNILVSPDGAPKLVDFGIAKPLDPERLFVTVDGTHPDARLMTPAYASPEQIKGEAVTTASDVFALGVLLYELLTGRRPYRSDSLPDIARAICEVEPTRPSAASDIDEGASATLPALRGFPAGTTTEKLRKQLKGDLDNIVLMAMRKEPTRRYASVEQFSDDIARYLAALPVRARSDTFQYRTGKFVRRHRLPVAAAAMVTMLLTASVVVLGHQRTLIAFERDTANDARARAEREATKAKAVNTFLQKTIGAGNPADGVGRDVTVVEALQRSLTAVQQEFSADKEIDAAIRSTVGLTYFELGRYEEAAPLLERAVQTRRQLYPGGHVDLAESLSNLAVLRRWQSRWTESEALEREALAMARKTAGNRYDLIPSILTGLASTFSESGDDKAAVPLYQEAVQLARQIPDMDAAIAADALNGLGLSQRRLGDYEAATRSYRDALEILRSRFGNNHVMVAGTLNNLAVALSKLARHAEAIDVIHEAIEIRRTLLGPDHAEVSNSMVNLAAFKEALGDVKGAEVTYREALTMARNAVGDEHPRVAKALRNLGVNVANQGRYGEAIVLLAEALQIHRKVYGDGNGEVADALQTLGAIYRKQNNYTEAEPLLREALSIFEKIGENSTELATAQTDYGVVLCRIGRHDAARIYLAKAVAYYDANPEKDDLDAAVAGGNYGDCLTHGRLYAEAEQQLTRAEARMNRANADARWKNELSKHFADLYDGWGKRALAAKYRPAHDSHPPR